MCKLGVATNDHFSLCFLCFLFLGLYGFTSLTGPFCVQLLKKLYVTRYLSLAFFSLINVKGGFHLLIHDVYPLLFLPTPICFS